MLYETARNHLLEQAQAAKAELTKDLPVNSPLRDLSVAEYKFVEKQLSAMFPEVHTALTSKEGYGITLVSKVRDTQSVASRTEISLSEKTAPYYDVEGNTSPAPKVSYLTSYEEAVEAPGVRGVVNNILATDGAIMLRAMNKGESVFNLYDAHMSGIFAATQNSIELNKAFYKTALNHSVPNKIAAMAVRTLKGFETIVGTDYEFTVEQYKKYGLDSKPILVKKKLIKVTYLKNIKQKIHSFKTQANYLTEAKIKMLTDSKVTVNHYYAEGAAVTYIGGTEVSANPYFRTFM